MAALVTILAVALAFLIPLAALVAVLALCVRIPRTGGSCGLPDSLGRPGGLSWCCVRIHTGERPVKVKALARIRVTS